ncbi:MAG: hypothetical protein MUF42_13000 [Cytophagaceae bacterium]|jgi:hypothetical protein|nr:hypothetical protein [Cytophagaceae bacterium]
MHRFFWQLIILATSLPLAHAQLTPEAAQVGDTIGVIETDTSITYIIKKPDLIVKNKIELLKERIKANKHVYSQYGFGMIAFRSWYFETSTDYLNELQSTRSERLSLAFQSSFIIEKKKWWYEVGIQFSKYRFLYSFTYNDERETSEQRFDYAGAYFSLSRKVVNRRRCWNFVRIKLSPNVLLSYGGSFDSDLGSPLVPQYLQFIIPYRTFVMRPALEYPVWIRFNKFYFQISPGLQFPIGKLNKSNPYFRERWIEAGLTFSLIHSLF